MCPEFPDLRIAVLAGVTLFTLLVFAMAYRFLENAVQRLFFVFSIGAIYSYCGFGAAYETVPWEYVLAYVTFVAVLAFGFVVTLKCTRKAGARFHDRTSRQVSRATGNRRFVLASISVYMIGSLLPLVYPEFNLARLVSPEAPDLRAVLDERSFYGEDEPAISRLFSYVTILSFPFYLISLYRFRRNYVLLAVLLAFPVYCKYCVASCVGRGNVATTALIYMTLVWFDNVRARKYLVAAGIVLIPLVSVAFYEYTLIRLGGERSGIGWQEAVQTLALTETSFPLDAGVIIESGYRADLYEYAKWLITLPVPKVLTGAITGSRINYELSEILLNKQLGTHGAYVRLTGSVTESIYIYGRAFCWIHALFIAAIMGLTCRILENHKPFRVLAIFTAILFSYFLHRGGISSLMPRLINGNMLFYLWIAYLCLSQARRSLTAPHPYQGSPFPLHSRDPVNK